MKSATIGDTWHLMGGWYELNCIPNVHCVSLEALVEQSSSESCNVWKEIPSLNCTSSCPINVCGSLLAVGGEDMKSKKPVSTILRYVPETNTWVHAGQLPHAVYYCTYFEFRCDLCYGRTHGTTELNTMFTAFINFSTH